MSTWTWAWDQGARRQAQKDGKWRNRKAVMWEREGWVQAWKESRRDEKATKHAELLLCATPSAGGFMHVITSHLLNPESIILPTLQMGKEVIKTLLDAFHIRILGLISNFCYRHSFTKWQCWNSIGSGTKKPWALGSDMSSVTSTLARKWLWVNHLIQVWADFSRPLIFLQVSWSPSYLLLRWSPPNCLAIHWQTMINILPSRSLISEPQFTLLWKWER